MSLLPQRKKSAEEIAKLRETLGIPGQAPAEEESPVLAVRDSKVAANTEVAASPSQEIAASAAPAPAHPPKPVRSLKKSEREPVLAAEPEEPVDESAAPTRHRPKIVRSLRKSEQVPLTAAGVHPIPDGSKLPNHRHSDRELNEIRRQVAISMQVPAFNPALQIAHLALVIPGYLFALAGALGFCYYELSLTVTVSCVGAALLVALYIFLSKPLSRHHAAFISVISLFVVVFGALYYFPQLRHGT
jgi:hypothetical protein